MSEQRFRWLLFSHAQGSLGLWTHRTALIWFTVVVTDGNAPSIGLVTSLQYAPMWLSALGGGLGDRLSKRRTLVTSQVIVVLACSTLAILAKVGDPGLPVLASFAVLLGLTAAVEAPIRLAFPREIVGAHLLREAIGLNGLVFQSSRVIGPALAGLGIAAFGESLGFAFAALCALGSSMSLLVVRTLPGASAGQESGASWRSTFRRIARDARLWAPLAGAVVMGACLTNLQVWLPLVVPSDGGASDYGTLLAAIGGGGAVGAILVASLSVTPSVRTLGALLAVQSAVTGFAAAIPVSVFLLIWVFLAGVVMQTYNTLAITVLQDATPDGSHGRVMGLYVVSYFVWAGAGTPLFGLLAGALGARYALAWACALCLLFSLVFVWRTNRERAMSVGLPAGRATE